MRKIRLFFLISIIFIRLLGLGFNDETYAQEPQVELTAIATTLFDLEWHPSGDLLTIATNNGIIIYDENLQEITRFVSHVGGTTALAWSPNGTKLATSGTSNDSSISIWNWLPETSTFTLDQTFLGNSSYEYFIKLAWSPDGAKLAVQGVSGEDTAGNIVGRIEIWNTGSWTLNQQFVEQLNPTNTLNWSQDGTLLAAGVYDGISVYSSYIVDVNVPELAIGISGPNSYSSVILNSSQFIVSADQRIGIYDIESGDLINTIQIINTFLRVNQSGRNLLGIDSLGNGQIVSVATGTTIFRFTAASNIRDIAWSPNDENIGLITSDGTVQIWDTSSLANVSGTPTVTPFPSLTPIHAGNDGQ
ncbi:MAG: hypothetical protein H7Y09_14285 [Chitinophagaceae bacterium]|nr:hypothetical protein [Anaerolineae bacterium]